MQHAKISHRLDSSDPRDEVNLADDGALCLDASSFFKPTSKRSTTTQIDDPTMA
jgi:hypothetical protein